MTIPTTLGATATAGASAFELVPIEQRKPCADCYACCIWLGVEEIHKHANVACKHLDGALGPNKRCGIYAQRPASCAKYICLYAAGLAPYRPNECGIICTPYVDSVNLIVFDEALSGEIDDTASKLAQTLAVMVDGIKPSTAYELRVVFVDKARILIFRNGLVFAGTVLPQAKGDWEALTFAMEDKHIGRYRTQDADT